MKPDLFQKFSKPKKDIFVYMSWALLKKMKKKTVLGVIFVRKKKNTHSVVVKVLVSRRRGLGFESRPHATIDWY